MRQTYGIRILDKVDRVVGVTLLDIFDKIFNGDSFYWSILYIDATGHLGEGKSILFLEDQINESKNGYVVKWDDLVDLSKKLMEIVDIVLLASKNIDVLHRYENDKEMYEACDIYIEMFDSCYWEVFSKDAALIESLASKFKEVKFLETDFVK